MMKRFRDIIEQADIDELNLFLLEHTDFYKYNSLVYPRKYDFLYDISLTPSEFLGINIMLLTPQIIDKLYKYDLIEPKILFIGLQHANSYAFWDNANYILNKLNYKVIKNAFIVLNPFDVKPGMPNKYNLLDKWRWCNITHYYGKIYPKALAFYNKIESYGCKPIYPWKDYDPFDLDYNIKWQEEHNTEAFNNFKKSKKYIEWLSW